MATLDSLKMALRQKATALASSQTQPLSDTQYIAGFEVLMQGPGWATYQDFIIPQLSQLLASLFNSRISVSVLEIGPGSQSVLGHLPVNLRRKIRKYSAFEPNIVFAARLEEWISNETQHPFPCLESSPDIHRICFSLDSNTGSGTGNEKFDIILFCHSMYGMKPKRRFIERALEMTVEHPASGMVVLFHRDGTLDLDGLGCHQTASFPTGVTRVLDDDKTLDSFAPFINGFAPQDVHVRVEWRKICRALGHREKMSPNRLVFDSPNVMVAFTRDAVTLPELTAQVPPSNGAKIKNRKARLYYSASIVRPTEVQHVQKCVQWALRHNVGLTVVAGGHSSHCLWPHVVSVDMSALDHVYIVTAGESNGKPECESGSLVVAEAGCKTGDIVSKAMEVGLTVPLGARPSVGAGLWLQGGIGHLARLHGLACDAIVGAVVVSVASGQVLCVGRVPDQHQPANAVRPENEAELLWAIKGAGSNFGIVVSVTFKTYTAPTFFVRDWDLSLSDHLEARSMLDTFSESAKKLSLNCSADAYLYSDKEKMHLGVTMFECSTTGLTVETPTSTHPTFGPEHSFKAVDGVGLYDTEMYICGMHGGHGGGKTSSFKRCVFLKDIGEKRVTDVLVTAIETCPSQLCYLHLLQGGGAVSDVPVDATAFGCRDWDFACVVTGVWPRNQDDTEAARAAEQWVYNVVRDLLPFSCGIYGADLGPDPRDVSLAAKAFGSNLPRLARLKRALDPRNVLAFACPLPKAPTKPKLIVLVTGDSCAGKDYCANIWVSVLSTSTDTHTGLTARAVSISEETKRQYAAATGTELSRLLSDRTYKEQHRPALTAFFQNQVLQRPLLPEENFLDVVHNAVGVEVLLITGMRDEAPVAAFSHLVPDSRLIEIRITAGEETRRTRRGCQIDEVDDTSRSYATVLNHRPTLIFDNETTGSEAATMLAEQHLLSFFDEDLQRLASMVRLVPDFPRVGIEFRHVLDICQQPGGLALCTSLLQTHFTGNWDKVDAIGCCEAGGFIFASSLAAQINKRMLLLRKPGKLPPPTVSVIKSPSYISSSSSEASTDIREDGMEMGRDVVPRGASIVVVEDVLATGKTLCAVLQLLDKAGITVELASVMVVAEFPLHRGRELLRQHGFGKVNVQSLLVFNGM